MRCPITALSLYSSCIPKILDALLANTLVDKLFLKFAEQQHGFIRGRSTLSNLLLFNDYLPDNLVRSTQVDTLYTDFSKAFDKVSHNRLLSKVWNMVTYLRCYSLI